MVSLFRQNGKPSVGNAAQGTQLRILNADFHGTTGKVLRIGCKGAISNHRHQEHKTFGLPTSPRRFPKPYKGVVASGSNKTVLVITICLTKVQHILEESAKMDTCLIEL
jgi:hypothetical protein